MSDKFILEGKTPKPAGLTEWAQWFGTADRHVGNDKIGEVQVSTVFLSINHDFAEQGEPILFETMVFGGEHDEFQSRCCTWDQAEEMHKRACEMVRGKLH